ncbi:MAG: hypothetical protein KTR32_19510, partial [Granulosicoccus sp.]|nr:hypothetical protein [Granulosicoccus sp.]
MGFSGYLLSTIRRCQASLKMRFANALLSRSSKKTSLNCAVIAGLLCVLSAPSIARSAVDDHSAILLDAQAAEAVGDYLQARVLYHRYLEKVPTAPDRLSLTQRASLLAEAVRFGPDAALPLVLDALTARESGDLDLAIQLLQEVDDNFRESALHDDALYLLGYFLLMERIDFEQAHIVLRRLQTEYPASSYSDTALYSEAIALEQLGNTQGARAKFLALRDKHTQVSIGFINQYWPKSTVMS